MCATLTALLADRSTIRQLYTLPEPSRIALMRAAEQFTPVRSRTELRGLVHYVFHRKFGQPLLVAPTVRVPWGWHQDKALVAHTAKQLFTMLPISRSLAAWYQSRVRVVCATGISLAGLLHNHRSVAATVSKSELLASTPGPMLRCTDLPPGPVAWRCTLAYALSAAPSAAPSCSSSSCWPPSSVGSPSRPRPRPS